MDYKVILNLMKEMNHYGLTKLEIEEEGVKICLEKEMSVVQAPSVQAIHSQYEHAQIYSPAFAAAYPTQGYVQPQTVALASTPQVNQAEEEKAAEEISGKKLVSPMVGTFYSAAGPDKAPFVKVGDKVKKGQTVCIIEAMKLMNEIEAEHEGEIVKILVNNEQMVEFGQPMFIVK